MYGAFIPLLFLETDTERYLCRACVNPAALELTQESVQKWATIPPWELHGMECDNCGKSFK